MECLLYVAMIVIAGIVYLNDYTDYKDSGGTAVVESNLKRNHHKVPRYGWMHLNLLRQFASGRHDQ